MSETPRTNAEKEYDPTNIDDVKQFARKLERELNASKADAESWREQAERFGQQLLGENSENSRLKLAYAKSHEEICQIAGKALGYPWFKDDQKNFPGATEDDGVCVGEHVAETIVAELAAKYAEANERIKKLELELEKAWRMYHKAAGEV